MALFLLTSYTEVQGELRIGSKTFRPTDCYSGERFGFQGVLLVDKADEQMKWSVQRASGIRKPGSRTEAEQDSATGRRLHSIPSSYMDGTKRRLNMKRTAGDNQNSRTGPKVEVSSSPQ